MATGFDMKSMLSKNSKQGFIDESPKGKFRTKDLSIFKIYPNDENFYPQNEIEEKAGEILSLGLLENLVVKYERKEGAGEYKLISGERRWRALNHLVEKGYKEFESVTCNIVSPNSDQEEKVALIIANSHRNKGIDVMMQEEEELKNTLQEMKDKKIELKGYKLDSGRLRDVMSKILNVSKTKIAQMEAVRNNLIPEFQEELKNGRMTFSAAYELSGMSTDHQKEALENFIDQGELTYKEIKDMKQQKMDEAAGQQLDGQMTIDEVSDADTEEDEEIDAHPVYMYSICYGCKNYSECNVKSETTTKCDSYINKAEEEKTDEQRYDEEQAAIDRETKQKLQEMNQEKKMDNIPSNQEKDNVKCVRVSEAMFEKVEKEKQRYMILKNDNYSVGQVLHIMEFKDARNTGNEKEVMITAMDDSETSTAIEDGYCVISI